MPYIRSQILNSADLSLGHLAGVASLSPSRLMHVFTADTVTRPRESFAMESVEVMTNAVGRPDQADAIRLEPGQRRTFRFGVTYLNSTTTLEPQ